MSLPASWTLITVTGTYLRRDGEPASGYVAFLSSQEVVIDGKIIVPKKIVATLDRNGHFQAQLPSTDDPDLNITGWAYTVKEAVQGLSRDPFAIFVPYNGGAIDMATVSPVVDPGELVGLATAAQMTALTARVDALESNPGAVWGNITGDYADQADAVAADEAARASAVATAAGDATTKASAAQAAAIATAASDATTKASAAASTAAGALAAHVADADPHPGYVLDSALGVSVAQLVAGVVPAGQLPSYVDDVLEFADLASFPATGETGKIYVAIDTNRNYRWTGSAYLWNNPSPGTTDALAEGASNQYFTQPRVLATILTGLSLLSAADVSAADTVLQSVGKLQGQTTAIRADLAANYQPIISLGANTLYARSSSGAAANKPVSDNALSFLAAADYAAMRAALVVPTGSGSSTGTNTGDQASIVGITGTKAQFDTSCSDGDFAYQSDLASFLTTAAAAAAYQPLDATLTALAGANWVANALPIGSGADALSQVAFAANTFPARASSGNLVAKTITDFGLSLVDDADAGAGRSTLGATTVGGNLFTLANPSAITFMRLNADNSVSALSAAAFKTALSLASSDVGLGNVTNDAQTKAAIVPNTAPSAGALLIGNAGGTAYAMVAVTGDVTLASTGLSTLATAQPAVHTWALAQTFTVAPVFTDQSGSRTALGLGTAATQNTGTSGATVPLLSTANTWTLAQTHSAAPVFNAGASIASGQTLNWNSDAFVGRRAAAGVMFGAADAAAPVAQVLSVQGARGGTDSNTAAVAFTVIGSLGTGTGTVGDLIFQTGTVAASGTTAHTATTRLTLNSSFATFTTPVQFNLSGNVAITLSGTAPAPIFTANSGFSSEPVMRGYAWWFQDPANAQYAGFCTSLGYNAMALASTSRITFSSTTDARGTADLFAIRKGAANWQWGAPDAAAPVAQTLSFQGARNGTDTNTAAVTTTIIGSLGTGTGATGTIVFQVGTPQNTGTAAHSAFTVLTLKNAGSAGTGVGQVLFPTGSSASPCLALASTPGTGWYDGGSVWVYGISNNLQHYDNSGETRYRQSYAHNYMTSGAAIGGAVNASYAHVGDNAFIFAGSASPAAGAATSCVLKNGQTTAIANNTATTVCTFTIPNAANTATFYITLTGILGAGGAVGTNEAAATTTYVVTITRTAGLAAVASAAVAVAGGAPAVAGAATATVTAAMAAMSGATSATQTCAFQVTIARSGGASSNHMCLWRVELLNQNASGITVA